MPTQSQNEPSVKIPLRIVLTVPFVVQVVLIVGLVGYLSFRNGQRAVNNVVHQLQSEITTRIEEHLLTFLDTPHQINQINANAIRQRLPDANDPNALERYFWEQIQVFDSVTSIYFGNTEGGLVDAGREGAKGSLYVIVTDEFTSGPFIKYATDSDGNRTEMLTTIPDFDARTRSWYIDAVEKAGATWSDIYILFTGHDMAIAASRPVHDEQQNLMGVVSVDIFTSHISDFMKNLKIGKTGQGFIMERSGLLVASSADEEPFTGLGKDKAQRRLYASESTVPIIRHTAEFLTERWGDYDNITTEQQFEFEIDGQRQFLKVAPVQDEYGIDWLIVIVIPESDFMAQINANNRATAFLVVAALMIAIVIGVVTAQWVTRPILRLNASTQALARGEWDQTTSIEWIGEIGELARSFDNMAGQLKQTLESLTSEIAERVRADEKIKHLNNILRAIRSVNQLITKEKDRDRLIARSCQLLVESRGYASAWLVLFDENQKPVASAQAGLGDEFSILLERMDKQVFNACGRQALEQTGVVAFEKPKSLCGDCPLLGQAPDFRALTIRLEHGEQIFGLLSVEIPAELVLDDEEQELFGEVANDIAFALHAIEMERERVRAESYRDATLEALRESEQNFRDLVENLMDGVAIVDENACHIYVNPKFTEITGYSREELLDMTGWDFTRPQDRAKLEQRMKDRIAGQPVQTHYERIIVRKDGTKVPVEMSTTVTTWHGKKRPMAIIHDITARVRAEEALRESEERFRLAFENTNIGMCLVDLNGRLIRVNSQMCEIFGYDQKELESMTVNDIAHPEDLDISPKFIQRAASGEIEHTQFEKRYLHKRGRIVWGQVSSSLVRDFQSAPLYFISHVQDITERVRAEKALRESEAKMRSIFRAAPIGIGLVSNRAVLDVNDRFCEITGYSKDELIGKDARTLYPTNEDYEYVGREKYRQIQEQGTGTVETRFKRKDDKLIEILLSSTPLDPTDLLAGVTFTALDITERVQAEEQIKQALAEKTTLLQELYHRTRNNMQVIHSMLALRSLHVQDEQLRTIVKDVQDKIQAMALAHQKLYDSRDLSRIDLKEYIDDLAAYLLQSYQVLPDRISLDLDTDSVSVLIDTAVPCGLVLSELISNALRHAFPGDRKGRISIRLHQAEDETITLQVSDDGIGVPGDFNQSDSLGLQTVVGMVERQLQGDISLETDRGVAWQIRFRDDLYYPRV